MHLRLAAPSDEKALIELCVALWPDTAADDHRDFVRAILAGRPPGILPIVFFVAEHDGALVGFAEVSLRSFVDGCDPARPCGFLEGWYVRPAFARQGVGRALVERAEQWAREQGCTEMGSDTLLDNEAGQRAHEALGFEVVDRCVNYRKSL